MSDAVNSWRDLVTKLTPDCTFAEPVAHAQIVAAQEALAVIFPDELSSLLQESNGVIGQYGLGLVWPIERIQSENLSFRKNEDFQELYMPFDSLLFFGDAGNGDQFAYAIQAGVIRRPDVFAWNHEDDSRTWQAPSLTKYLEWWLSGRISL
jgi:hypothetical protein